MMPKFNEDFDEEDFDEMEYQTILHAINYIQGLSWFLSPESSFSFEQWVILPKPVIYEFLLTVLYLVTCQ